jgi:hypothetical protein
VGKIGPFEEKGGKLGVYPSNYRSRYNRYYSLQYNCFFRDISLTVREISLTVREIFLIYFLR